MSGVGVALSFSTPALAARLSESAVLPAILKLVSAPPDPNATPCRASRLPALGVEGSAERDSCAVEFDPGELGENLRGDPVSDVEPVTVEPGGDVPGVEEPDSGVSAQATPVPVATAAPTPNATAKAPIRPTRAAALVVGLIKYTPVVELQLLLATQTFGSAFRRDVDGALD